MQDNQSFFNTSSNNAKSINQPGNFFNVTATKNRKFNSLSILGLITSVSSLGIAFFSHQPVNAQSNVSQAKNQNLIQQLPSLTVSPPTIEQESLIVSDLSHNQAANSLISLQINSPSQNNTNKIPQLPTLNNIQSNQIHTVQTGDTIAKIARQYGVSRHQIIDANQLINPHNIDINLKLIIPNAQLSQTNNQDQQITPLENQLVAQNSLVQPAAFSSLVEKKAESRYKKTDLIPLTNTVIETENESISSENTNTKEPYINKLRQDIVKLRNKYQTQNGTSETINVEAPVSTTNITENNDFKDNLVVKVEDQTQTTDSTFNDQERVATATIPAPKVNSLISLVTTNTITPDLPPLASPEEYLPDNPIFNGYIWPAQGTLTSGYGWRWGRMHKGIDIAAPIGTPIIAAAPGEVIFAGWNSGGYGNLVKLKHSDGSVTFYAHNNRVLVSNGQKVKQGQLIAEMGSTGRSTGPHLHFEIRPNGSTAIDPIALLPQTR